MVAGVCHSDSTSLVSCSAPHKRSYHPSPYNAIKKPLHSLHPNCNSHDSALPEPEGRVSHSPPSPILSIPPSPPSASTSQFAFLYSSSIFYSGLPFLPLSLFAATVPSPRADSHLTRTFPQPRGSELFKGRTLSGLHSHLPYGRGSTPRRRDQRGSRVILAVQPSQLLFPEGARAAQNPREHGAPHPWGGSVWARPEGALAVPDARVSRHCSPARGNFAYSSGPGGVFHGSAGAAVASG